MATRKPTPNVLGDLLGEPSTTQHTARPVQLYIRTPGAPHTRVPVDHTVERVKATFYLHAEVLERLGDSRHQLGKLAKSMERGKVSKSLIVEVALELALQDLEGQGEAKPLASKIEHP